MNANRTHSSAPNGEGSLRGASASTLVLAFVLAAASLAAAPHIVHAQPRQVPVGAGDSEALALFEAGRIDFEQGRFADAYGRFVEAYELSHRPGLLYNIATAADRSDQTAEAIAFYERYLAEVPEVDNRAFIEGRLGVLRARPVAAIEASPPRVEATRETETDALPPVGSASPAEPDSAPPPSRSDADPTASIALFTLAGLAGAGAIVTGVMGWTARSEVELACPMRACVDGTLRGRAEEMATLGIVTDVLAGASLALAATGLVTFLLMPPSTDQRALSLALGPSGITLRGTY